MNKKPLIFDIQHFCIHDGPGIRTTVFLKGCPLSCRWCHNPEGQSICAQILYDKSKCKGCGECEKVCTACSHRITAGGGHEFIRERCTLCQSCVECCPYGALTLCGKYYGEDELFDIIMSERAFYKSDGGVTFSGGEALLYPEYISSVMKKCKGEEITTAIDTSGFAPWSAFEKTIPVTDTYLYDIKFATSELHKKWTGHGNELILENLFRLDECGRDIYIRIPVIGGANDTLSEFGKIGDIISRLNNVKKVTLLPYHSFGKNKYSLLGTDYTVGDSAKIPKERIGELRDILVSTGICVDEVI